MADENAQAAPPYEAASTSPQAAPPAASQESAAPAQTPAAASVGSTPPSAPSAPEKASEAPRGTSDVDPTVGSSDPSAEDEAPVEEFGGPDAPEAASNETSGEPLPRAVIPERTPIVTTVPVDARNGDQSGFSVPIPVSEEARELARALKAEADEAAEILNGQIAKAREKYAADFAKTDQGQQHKQIEAAEAAMRDTGTATQEGHDWLDIDSNAPMRVV